MTITHTRDGGGLIGDRESWDRLQRRWNKSAAEDVDKMIMKCALDVIQKASTVKSSLRDQPRIE